MAAISSSHRPHVVSADRRAAQRSWRTILRLGLMFCDLLAINAAFIGVYLYNLEAIISDGMMMPSDPNVFISFLIVFDIATLTVFASTGLYRMHRGGSRVDEAFKIFTAVSLTTVVALLINTLLPEISGSEYLPWTRTTMASSWLVALISCIGMRAIHRSIVIWLRQHGMDTRRVLIVGAREPGQMVWNVIRRHPDLGYRVQGFLSDSAQIGSVVESLPVLGRTSQLGRVVRATHADEVIIALSGRSTYDLVDVISFAEDEAVEIKIYPDTFQLITNNGISVGDLSDLPLISVKNAALDNPWNRILKRALDIVVATAILLLGSPFFMFVALAVWVESRGPVFFLQERVGMDSRPFWMIKFRTMRIDAEQISTWTVQNDPRITRVGKLLRRTSLDELPQLINVLIGNMSIVGPRPEQLHWVEQFSQQIPRYMRRHKEKAGLTGWAQVNGLRGDTSIEERTRYDLYYIENWSLLFDIKIILRTIATFLAGAQENAY